MAADESDGRWMRRALELAERGWGRVAPNPVVGSVMVRNGEVVGEGWHAEYGRPHAEAEALRRAGERARGATAYVTLEPCSHHGKTPPCVDALIGAGVARVVYACADPNPAAGGGAARLMAAGVEVRSGVEEQAARDLVAPFLHRFGPAGDRRPWCELKLALSLDAALADADGRSAWVTGEEARAEVHRLRAGHDAVAVGIGTALADDPLLTARGTVQPRVAPARVVFDRALRLPLESRLVATAREHRLIVVAAPDAPAVRREALVARGATVLAAPSLEEGLRALRGEGIASMFCEGGARIAGELLRAEAVDRLSLFYAPVLLGAGSVAAFAGVPASPIGEARRWRVVRSARFGADVHISLAP